MCIQIMMGTYSDPNYRWTFQLLCFFFFLYSYDNDGPSIILHKVFFLYIDCSDSPAMHNVPSLFRIYTDTTYIIINNNDGDDNDRDL